MDQGHDVRSREARAERDVGLNNLPAELRGFAPSDCFGYCAPQLACVFVQCTQQLQRITICVYAYQQVARIRRRFHVFDIRGQQQIIAGF